MAVTHVEEESTSWHQKSVTQPYSPLQSKPPLTTGLPARTCLLKTTPFSVIRLRTKLVIQTSDKRHQQLPSGFPKPSAVYPELEVGDRTALSALTSAVCLATCPTITMTFPLKF